MAVMTQCMNFNYEWETNIKPYYELDFKGILPDGRHIEIYKPLPTHPSLRNVKERQLYIALQWDPENLSRGKTKTYLMDLNIGAQCRHSSSGTGSGVQYMIGKYVLWRSQFPPFLERATWKLTTYQDHPVDPQTGKADDPEVKVKVLFIRDLYPSLEKLTLS